MAEIVTMPKLGFDMAEGTLVRWVIQEDEQVAKGDVLAEIETDKATVEVEATFEGVVARHLVPEGEIVPINAPIALIVSPGEQADPEAIEALIGEKKESIAAEKPIEQKEEVTDVAHESTGTSASELASALLSEDQQPGMLKASPLARRMARDMHIDLKSIQGSGPGGRITKKDVQAYVTMQSSSVAKPTGIPAAPSTQQIMPLSPFPPDAPITSEIIALNPLRSAIGRRMSAAKQQIPHFYVTHKYDVAGLIALRKQINGLIPEQDKISLNDFIIKAVALTLRQYPNLNASLQGDQVVHHGQVNIGVAVAVEGGLLTVVCHNSDRKPLRQIATEVRTKVSRARQGKVRPEDIEGSTFSVSNMGMYDVEHFVAIINPPEAAILAIGSARQVPVFKDDEIVPGWRMKATVSVDHRISDGVEAAQFLKTLALYLEEPIRLLL
jgi:pyruvate dehydrogenase E2 component (dihydrolipoamide acetyltransferase)